MVNKQSIYKYIRGEVIYSYDKMLTAFQIAEYYGLYKSDGSLAHEVIEKWMEKFRNDNSIDEYNYFYVNENNEVYQVWTYDYVNLSMNNFIDRLPIFKSPNGDYCVSINDTTYNFCIHSYSNECNIINFIDYIEKKGNDQC